MRISSSRRLRRLAGLAVLLGSPVFCLTAQAQTPPQKNQTEPFRLKTRVELVAVDVSVTDVRGNFLRDLTRDNFRVLDDGLEQPIAHFAPVESPAVVLVLVETGPAVYLIHRQHLEAAHALLDGLAADDRVALGTYDQTARMLLPFTADKGELARALLGLRYNLGMAQLNLFESLAKALEWLAPGPDKKAVVLLSTGLDSGDRARWEALERKLQASEVVIFPVALGGELRQFKMQEKAAAENQETTLSFERADRDLEALARLTGGRAYFPQDTAEFPGIYRQIAATLRHQYSLGFRPPARDARFHHIEVQVINERGNVIGSSAAARLPRPPGGTKPPLRQQQSGYRIHARQGYLATGP